ncbi:MAG TPA: UDP-glucose--hexose-1-phosphate uridylyltransferase [Gemmatimonadaceae bacterium]|nr:UDP-glucose--hexose-1-phosphate uridylyltransferase [Gemmatimonadaceae bacterium]
MSEATELAGRASVHALAEEPHRRLNLLTGEWVLVSPHRTQRPWQGQVERRPAEDRPRYDPTCYLCPGNARAGGARNPEYTGTFVFDNDFAALRPGGSDAAVDADGLLVARSEPGVCRVICFSPRHDLSLPDMEPAAIRGVIDVWAEEYARLGSRPEIGAVQIFENKGEVMGCSNPHPHGQIWAQRSVPLAVARETERLAEHHRRHRRTVLEEYLRLELELQERVVCANDGFVALVPFWAVWPYETLVISRRPRPHLGALDDADRDLLADVVKRLTTRYDNLFEISFPYSAGIHQAPTDGRAHPEWHLHMHFYPPLLRSATVRKFLVGYEMLGEPQRDLTPEAAAERLRALPEVHVRQARGG